MALIVELEITGVSTKLRYFEAEFSSSLNRQKMQIYCKSDEPELKTVCRS